MKQFENRSQEQRLSMGEQRMKLAQPEEEEVDFSVIFAPPVKKPETD